jgi:CRP-like cAMP-binding protein
MARVTDYMRAKHLPVKLRDKVQSVYHARFAEGKMYNEHEILAELKESGSEVMREVLEFNAREIIGLVPVLSDAPHRFQERVATMLHPDYGFPDEIVFAEGEHPEFLFFVHSGLLDVLIDYEGPNERVVATVGDGSYLGDTGMLLDKPHGASVKCRTQCIMYRAPCADFMRLLADYPAVHQFMMDIAQKRSLQHGQDTEDARTALRLRAAGNASTSTTASSAAGRRASMQALSLDAAHQEQKLVADLKEAQKQKQQKNSMATREQAQPTTSGGTSTSHSHSLQMTEL